MNESGERKWKERKKVKDKRKRRGEAKMGKRRGKQFDQKKRHKKV